MREEDFLSDQPDTDAEWNTSACAEKLLSQKYELS